MSEYQGITWYGEHIFDLSFTRRKNKQIEKEKGKKESGGTVGFWIICPEDYVFQNTIIMPGTTRKKQQVWEKLNDQVTKRGVGGGDEFTKITNENPPKMVHAHRGSSLFENNVQVSPNHHITDTKRALTSRASLFHILAHKRIPVSLSSPCLHGYYQTFCI